MSEIPMIGAGRDRVDGRAKVTGTARYAAENNLPNLVHAVVVSSTIPSGTIRAIDTTAAKKAPGVLAVLSHVNASKLNPPPSQGGGKSETGGGGSASGGAAGGGTGGGASGGTSGQKQGGQSGGQQQGGGQPSGNFAEPRATPFSDGTIHYLGQQIAVVVADTLEHATHAAELVEVTYDARPGRTDMNALRHEAKDKGAQQAPPFVKGDPEGAFAGAAVKIDRTYRTPYHHHNPIEAHSIVVAWDGDRVTLHDSSQNIFASRQTIAHAFGIPKENVHVVSPFVGGAFGSKGSTWPHVLVGALAAREVKRPVKLWLPRKQLFFTNGHRPETEQRVALGATSDGKLVSIIHEGISQSNAVCDYNERFTRPTRVMYATPNMRAENLVVDLNVSSPTYMRAPGENPGMFALESAMDELAYAVNIDPVQLRLINYAEEDPSDGKPWSSKSLRECYERAAARFGWADRKREPRSMRDGRLLVGQGMASATYPSHRSPASARARMNDDGTVVVSSGSHEMGMGTATVMAQLAAETLGIPAERVRFEYGDTNLPQAPISAGSMTAASVGSAVYQVARELRQKLVALNGGDEIANANDYAALLHAHYTPDVETRVDAKPDPEEAHYSAHAFGCHFAEVSVDPDLGLVRLRRMVSAFAGGRILNAKTAHSQFLGGIVQGIGMALLEETHLDRRFGSYTNVNFGEYLVPVNADVRNLTILMLEEQDPHVNPIGAKGIGEVGIVGVAPAIANAVYHATGKRVRDLPITLEKLL
ncbi:MAG: xanthine dehydrogenase family protein molybdopterin-binding subunit [Acidobacteria bacterium]|nr:xanthine dehydrogenase family protein molybdopterin-binding subunit [Acidobacteriota bacterium]MBV9476303.1 xanthine dehydrogenase family protein molybdopterin-binding subunit [Acidobacteriota bacterium]